MIYLDYAATTPPDDEILALYVKSQKNFFANLNSLHKLGQESKYMYDKCLEEIAKVLALKNKNIVFTTSASEANNLGIQGIIKDKQKSKIITTKIEHPSVYNVFKHYEDSHDIIYLGVDKNGLISLEELEKELNEKVLLVSIMWVNNISGAVQNIKEIIKLVKKFPKAKLHVDMVQGFSKIKADFDFNDIDLFTISMHKIYGLKAAAFLIVNSDISLEKIMYSANSFLKVGTIDLASLITAVRTIKKYYPLQEENFKRVLDINLYFKSLIKDNKNIVINSGALASPYIFNISIKGINSETIIHILDKEEVYISSGSACSSKLKVLEKTIMASFNDEARAESSVRISFSHLTKKEDVLKLSNILNDIAGE